MFLSFFFPLFILRCRFFRVFFVPFPLSVWRVRRTSFPSECVFLPLRPRAGFFTSAYVRIQSINQSIIVYFMYKRGPCLISPHFFDARTFAVVTFDIEPQKQSRVKKHGAQTKYKVMQRSIPPFTSKQSQITCAGDKSMVFNSIGQAVISGSTALCYVPLHR